MKKGITAFIIFVVGIFSMHGFDIKKNIYDAFNKRFKDIDTIIDEKSEVIIQYLEQNNVQQLLSLYCPSVIKNNQNLESDISALCKKLNIRSYEILNVVSFESGHFGDGQGIVQRNVVCELKINSIEYEMSFIYIKKNYADKKDVGLYSLELIETSKTVPNAYYYNEMTPGIYDSLKKGK